MPKKIIISTLVALLLGASVSLSLNARVIEISPAFGGCSEEFENVANDLQPGDELILRGGTYSQDCRRYIDVRGTASQPILIRAAEGEIPLLTRPDDPTGSQTQNGIEIYGEHLIIRGLHFTHGDTGVRFMGGSHHITFEDCEVSNTSNNAITLNSGNTDSFIIRRNHIHHTGLRVGANPEGEGMYVGGNRDMVTGLPKVVASNHLIAGNYIHHLRSTSDGGNDGIEIKFGSYGNVIRDNVIHDTNIGEQFPCIFVYGVRDQDVDKPNIVEGNVMWNCGEAIQVSSDVIVRNNLILNSSINGITASKQTQVTTMRNTQIVNNTIYGHPTCLYLSWEGASNMVLANNTFYCPGNTAVRAVRLSGNNIVVTNNYVEGAMSNVSVDGSRFFSGGSASTAFVNPAGLDFWPAVGSPLLGAANADYVPNWDFNWNSRQALFDVGAYETEGLAANPGWPIAAEFKGGGVVDNVAPAPPSGLEVE